MAVLAWRDPFESFRDTVNPRINELYVPPRTAAKIAIAKFNIFNLVLRPLKSTFRLFSSMLTFEK